MPTTIKVFGNVKDVSRFAKSCTVTIKLINGPINEDPNLIVPTELVRQTDSAGYFEAQLGLGNYGLFIGSDQILFSVTDIGSGDKNIVSLLNEDLSYTRDPYNSNWNGLRQGNIQFLPIAMPSAPTNSILDSGGAITGLDGDIYDYLVSFVTAIGETLPSSVRSDLTGYTAGGGNFVRITFDPTDSLSNVIKIRIYRSVSGALDGTFVILAEVDPTVPYYEDKQTYEDTSGYAVADVPQSNTTAGGIYSGTQLVAQVTSETGLDASFRLRIPDEPVDFGGLLFDRELCIREDVYGPFIYYYLVIRNGGKNFTIGNIFDGGIGYYGLVPPPPTTGYSGTRVLQEDGTWVEPSGGGGGGLVVFLTSTSNYTADGTEEYVVLKALIGNPFTFTLPPKVANRRIKISVVNSVIEILFYDGDTSDTVANLGANCGDQATPAYFEFVTDGAEWVLVNCINANVI